MTHIGWQLAALPVTASSCPLGTGEKTQRTGREVRLPNRCAVCFPLRPLSHLRHEVAHGLGCLILLLAGGVGVCPQGEPCVVVPQHGRDGFDVHAALEGQSGEGVPLRYNYDKPEKPRRIKGFEVFSLVFSSFSKPKNHTEISRIIGGVSLTTNE